MAMSSQTHTVNQQRCIDDYPLAQKLLCASAKGNLHKVIELLKQGANLAVNKHGRTALHISSHRGYLDIVIALLQCGCHPDIQDDNGDTALHRAVSAGLASIVQRLLDEACDVDRQNNLGDTALHEAARCGHKDIVTMLIQSKANVYCRNNNDDTALHMACANGHSSAALLLLRASATHSCLNKQKDSPLHLAVRFGHSSCARVLLDANCDLNCQNEVAVVMLLWELQSKTLNWYDQLTIPPTFRQFGNTALHIATASLQKKLVRMLLDANADAKKVKNNDGKSALDLSKDMNDGELVLMLMSGARYHERRASRTPHHRRRSRSESRDKSRRKSSSEECRASPTLKRPEERTKIRRRSSHRNSMRKLHHHNRTSHHTIEEEQKKLIVNPYVVPQLYSLYRDDKGSIHQVPVIDRLPNPTPQVVQQLHLSIQQVRDGWQHSLQQIQTSFEEKLQELKRETNHRLKSIDKLTQERLSAERTECLHRIDRQMACERLMKEDKALNDLKLWVENRFHHLEEMSGCITSPTDEQDTAQHGRTHSNSQRTSHSSATHSNGEAEVRSWDSEMGGSCSVVIPSVPPTPSFRVDPSSVSRVSSGYQDHVFSIAPPGACGVNSGYQYDPNSSYSTPILPLHSTPHSMYCTKAPYHDVKAHEVIPQSFYPCISSPGENFPYYSQRAKVSNTALQGEAMEQQLFPFDCNDEASLIHRLRTLKFGEVHAV